jgi:hypothetical protein
VTFRCRIPESPVFGFFVAFCRKLKSYGSETLSAPASLAATLRGFTFLCGCSQQLRSRMTRIKRMIRMTRLRLAVATLTHAPARRRSKVERSPRRLLNALTEAMRPLPPDICLRLRRPFSSSVRALHGESATGLAFSGEADPPLKQSSRLLSNSFNLLTHSLAVTAASA